MITRSFFGFVLLAVTYATLNAEDIEGGFIYDYTARSYFLHIPEGYDGQDSLPLVIALHGASMNGKGMAATSELSPKADSENFFVVYPDGAPDWNAFEDYGVDDVGFISTLIDTLKADYVIDTLRVYVTGFSRGAMMSYRLGCELAIRIAAIAPVAGGLIIDDWSRCQPERLMPIMHFHARNDPIVPYDGDEDLASVDSVMRTWAERNGCSIGPDTFYNEKDALRQRWSREDDSSEVVLWTTEEGWHTWPGSTGGSQEVEANDEMWEFFLEHPIPLEEEPGITEPDASPPLYLLDPLLHNFPDPFTSSATISFTLDRRVKVSLRIFDATGRTVAALLDEELDAGEHLLVIDGSGLSAGVYFCQLITPAITETRRMIFIK